MPCCCVRGAVDTVFSDRATVYAVLLCSWCSVCVCVCVCAISSYRSALAESGEELSVKVTDVFSQLLLTSCCSSCSHIMFGKAHW